MEYPYYIIPDIEALPSVSGEERQRLVRRIAALVGDPNALREVLGIDPEEFAQFYPDMAKTVLSTEDTIDSFINKYGDKKTSETREEKTVEEIIPLPPADYDLSAIEESPIITDEPERETNEDATAALLSSFLKQEPVPTPKPTPTQAVKPIQTPIHKPSPANATSHDAPARSETETKRNENPSLSESLARAMIKNGNYRKALEIITDLSLKNPKKSIYFADQIRFLKKLILNQSKSQN